MLILASKAQSVAMAIALVETGMICVSVQDSAGVTAMMVATHRRKTTLLDLLIARRADVNVQVLSWMIHMIPCLIGTTAAILVARSSRNLGHCCVLCPGQSWANSANACQN